MSNEYLIGVLVVLILIAPELINIVRLACAEDEDNV